jgi:DNA-binding transcriptional LysR family regulator
VRRLEEQLGVRLLARTTRSVMPTDAGQELLSHLRPALDDVRGALSRLARRQEHPVGRVRLVLPRYAALAILGPKIGEFTRKYPEVVLDVTTNDNLSPDIVGAGFDAGIHFGEFIARDMVAVRVSADYRAAIVGSPAYFETHPKPRTPADLPKHRCINFRHGSEGNYRWELDKGEQSVAVAVTGPVVLDDEDLGIRAAVDGVGLFFVSENRVLDLMMSGALVRVLEDWCPPFPGFFLYYPSRRHQPAALAALVETLRVEG